MLKFIVLFTVVAFALAYDEYFEKKYDGAPLGPDGKVVDTFEVKIAKEDHLAAVEKAKHELEWQKYKDIRHSEDHKFGQHYDHHHDEHHHVDHHHDDHHIVDQHHDDHHHDDHFHHDHHY